MRQLGWDALDAATRGRRRVESWLFGESHALWASTACRILTALSVLGLLLGNFSSRDIWVGQGSIWAEPARAVSQFPELALLRNVSSDILTLVYVATILAALAFLIGWHTNAANIVTLIGFIAIVGQNPVVSVQGDNLIRLTLLWLLLMQTAEHWSLDARRRAKHQGQDVNALRQAWNGDQVLPTWLTTSLHNIGLVGLATQTVLIYLTAGLDKVSQAVWQDGTALFATLQLPEYRPFPWLSDLVSGSEVLLAVVTYAVLLTQLFFGPLLLNSITRRIVLGLAIAVNLLFAVLFATPWSSLAIIAVTLLFVSDRTFERLDDWLADVLGPLGDRLVEGGYRMIDALDALRYRFVFPVVDWLRATVLRR